VGQLDEPAGLAITTSGLLYVADTWNRRVSVFTLDGQPASMFTASDGTVSNSFRVRGWADDLGNRPYLAVDAVQNLIYITDPDAGRVLIYDTLGKCVGSFGQLSREAAPDLTQFSSVGGLGLDSVGNLIVSDAGAGRLLRFAPYQVPPPVVEDANVQPESTAEATVELVAPVGLEVTGEVIGPIEAIEMTPESTPAG
jgi:sugar lactone lactonase YvrE